MRICSFRSKGEELAGIRKGETLVPVYEINKCFKTDFPISLGDLILKSHFEQLSEVIASEDLDEVPSIPLSNVQFCAPYRNPPKIWGIGLNFREHAIDLDAVSPEEEPASFMKPATTIIGIGDGIVLPPQSNRVTGEAEIGVIIGRECKCVSVSDAPDVILGYTTVIDMTAEDILRRNLRFMTRAKSFDTFFSFGPWIATPNEIPNVLTLEIATFINGERHRSNTVGNMTFPPFELVSFHSHVMTLKPGDIISCGTPGAVVIRPGDCIGCKVSCIGNLENPVVGM